MEIEAATGLMVVMSPVDLCRYEFKDCWSGGCTTKMVVDTTPVLVNSNRTSFAGIGVTYVQVCQCDATAFGPWTAPKCSDSPYSCLNGGTCLDNWNGYK